jgi:hypothetical protein
MSVTAQLFPVPAPTRKAMRLPQAKSSVPDAVVKCQDNLVFMRSLPEESMKLIVTSPPYNLGKAYETNQSQQSDARTDKPEPPLLTSGTPI